MKVCPKCGYVDVSGWRQNRWRTNVEFISLSEFEIENPRISRSLKDGKSIETDEYYAYRLTGRGKNIVERVWIETYKIAGKKAFHIPREHFNHKFDPYQTRLEEKRR